MQGFRSGQREVEHTSFREWTTVIHDHNDAALRSWVGNAKTGAERKVAVGSSEFLRIIRVATGCAARIVGAVVCGSAGKLTGRLSDSYVGRAPD